MAYTHSFEIEITGMQTISGELDFDDPGNGIKIINGDDIELTKTQWNIILDSINRIFNMECKCGNIVKFEVAEK